MTRDASVWLSHDEWEITRHSEPPCDAGMILTTLRVAPQPLWGIAECPNRNFE